MEIRKVKAEKNPVNPATNAGKMGAAASIALPEGWDGLSDEEKEKYQITFNALKESGKSDEEALAALVGTKAAGNEQAVEEEGGAMVVKIPLTGLLEAIEQAVEAGKTPLVVDRSADDKVNTFFSYRSAMVLDGKKMGLDKSMKKIPVGLIADEARKKLVSALKLGMPLIIALTTSVTDFATTFNDSSVPMKDDANVSAALIAGQHFLPLEMFTRAGKGLLEQEMMDTLFREEDRDSGIALSREPDHFHVCITTRFAPEDFEEYLFSNDYGLPKPKEQYQFIVIEFDADEPLLD
jgi:hypothetical protein